MLCVKTLIYRDAVDYVILVGLGCHRWTTRISRKKLIYLQEKNGFCSVEREKREKNYKSVEWIVSGWFMIEKKTRPFQAHIFTITNSSKYKRMMM